MEELIAAEQPVIVPVDDPSRISHARWSASELARKAGFSEERTGAVAIVITEAATNIAKHAGQGVIQLRTTGGGEPAIEILAIDSGPGMRDIAASLRDGVSTTGTSGTGLGAISRLASNFDIYSTPDKGTVLVARVCRSEGGTCGAGEGAVQAPLKGESVSGDAWTVVDNGATKTVMMADGLGHGPLAAEAAGEAVRIVCAHGADHPAALLERIHRGLRGTRGAAVSIARLDPSAGTVVYAGLGNVAGMVLDGAAVERMVAINGTAGHQARKISEFRYPYSRRGLLIMHSDGIATHWELSAYPGLAARDPSIIAGVLYRDQARGRDDATVLAMRLDE